MSTTAKRAAPLPPAARREAIVSAVLPFVVKHGTAVTSRDLARPPASPKERSSRRSRQGRPFRRGLARAIDPEPAERRIEDSIPTSRSRNASSPPPCSCSAASSTSGVFSEHRGLGRAADQRRMPASAALTALFAGESDLLRIAPRRRGRQFRSLVLALSHPSSTILPHRRRDGRAVPARRRRAVHEPRPPAARQSRPPPGAIVLLVLLQALQTTANLVLPAISALG